MNDGREGKRQGMAQADENANEHWKHCYDECGLAIAQDNRFFSTDEIEKRMRETHPNVTTHERRAIGPRMSAGARAGWWKKTNVQVKSAMRECHCRPKTIWESLVFV